MQARQDRTSFAPSRALRLVLRRDRETAEARAVALSGLAWPDRAHDCRTQRYAPGDVSSGCSVVVLQQSAQTLSPFHLALAADVHRIRAKKLVSRPWWLRSV